MPQNINNVQYARMPAERAQLPPPAGQRYHLPGNTLVGEYSARRMNHRQISDHKLTLGVPPHAEGHYPAEYLTWRNAVKDQILARGYITDNSQFPDAKFQQIVGGMRRLKPACDELATVSAVNNIPSMQEIDEAVLQLVKASGKKLAHTIKTTKKVPPGPGVPPGQVIVNPVLLRLNAPAQCQCSIATGVPNGGPVVQNGPRPAQNAPAPPANPQPQNNPPLPAIPQAQLIPHPPAHIPAQIQQAVPLFIPGTQVWVQHVRANPQAQNNPLPPAIPQAQLIPHPPAHIPAQIQQAIPLFIPGAPVRVQHAPAIPQAQNNPGPANLQPQNNPPLPQNNPLQIQHALPMFIPGTRVGVQDGPAVPQAQNNPCSANLHPQNNPQLAANNPAQIQPALPMFISGTPVRVQDAPPADIQAHDVARQVPLAASDPSPISEFSQ